MMIERIVIVQTGARNGQSASVTLAHGTGIEKPDFRKDNLPADAICSSTKRRLDGCLGKGMGSQRIRRPSIEAEAEIRDVENSLAAVWNKVLIN